MSNSVLLALLVVGALAILALVVAPEVLKSRKRPLGQRRKFLPRHVAKVDRGRP